MTFNRHSTVFLRSKPVNRLVCLLLLNSLALSNGTLAKEPDWLTDWQEARADRGFTAKCRKHHSGIKQCIFSTLVDTPVGALTAVVQDVGSFTEWAESVVKSERMPSLESDDAIVVYTAYSSAGAQDRFAVTRYVSQYWKGSSTVRVSFQTFDEPDPYSEEGLMRFEYMSGYWQFTALEGGKTRIEHKSLALPGGFVQSSLSYFYNIAYLDASFKTIRRLNERAGQAPFIEAKIDWENAQIVVPGSPDSDEGK